MTRNALSSPQESQQHICGSMFWYCFACPQFHVLWKHDSALVLDCPRWDHEHLDIFFLGKRTFRHFLIESRLCKAISNMRILLVVKCYVSFDMLCFDMLRYQYIRAVHLQKKGNIYKSCRQTEIQIFF